MIFAESSQNIESRVLWRDGTEIDFSEFERKTHTNAMLILQDGKIVYEKYIVKLSDHGAEEDEALTLLAFQVVSEELLRSTTFNALILFKG